MLFELFKTFLPLHAPWKLVSRCQNTPALPLEGIQLKYPTAKCNESALGPFFFASLCTVSKRQKWLFLQVFCHAGIEACFAFVMQSIFSWSLTGTKKPTKTDHLLEFLFEFNLMTAAFDKSTLRLTFFDRTQNIQCLFSSIGTRL